jgi:hypothetical protein
MIERRRLRDRIATTLGALSLLATLLLISPGVRAVRAEGEELPVNGVDPAFEAQLEVAAPAPVPSAAPKPVAPSASPSPSHDGTGTGLPPDVRVLNTRGYNYGPPPGGVDPRSMPAEAPPAQAMP